jgi:hypothetical protein
VQQQQQQHVHVHSSQWVALSCSSSSTASATLPVVTNGVTGGSLQQQQHQRWRQFVLAAAQLLLGQEVVVEQVQMTTHMGALLQTLCQQRQHAQAGKDRLCQPICHSSQQAATFQHAGLRAVLCPSILCDAGADHAAVSKEFIEKNCPEFQPVESPDTAATFLPRKCSMGELLLLLKLDVAGVADMHLGTSWLHEAVRWAGAQGVVRGQG